MLEIKRTVKESVVTTDGKELKQGDDILIKVGKQDIVTKFDKIEKGYFSTVNNEGEVVKYRKNSIDYCYKVLSVKLDREEDKDE